MMMNSWQYFAADYYANLEVLAAVLAVLIIISGLDDLVIDVWYWSRRINRWFTNRKTPYRPLTAVQLQERAEQPLAVMVPAWMEYDVIAAMIENMVTVMDYKNYVIFVGTYVNDAATIAEVERMRRRYKQLRRVEVPNPGPTCKADCLNWVIQAIFKHEEHAGIEFAGMILHDSEDVLHPLELKFYNYLLPRKDMIQLPVMSLERKWYELVAGTYMDEFAESHGKDMLVRESVSGVVPSAGVGTCFSRKAILALNAETQNQPFNTMSLTEDYDIGNRLAHMGMRSIFAIFPVQFLVKQDPWFVKSAVPAQAKLADMPLCVREYFPDTFRTAYRQKARWTLGIGLQSWEQIKFTGPLVAKYLLLRDRKGVLTALISMLAYFLLIQFVIFQTAAYTGLWTVYYPPLFSMDGWWPYVLLFNGFALLNRIGHRMYFVSILYGWRHGLMSVPRMIVSNFVNFMAVARAWKLYLNYLFMGSAMVWDKTMHDFPSAENLIVQKQRIGDLLQSWQAVDESTLKKALEEQARVQLPLGRVLVSNGWLDDETLAEVIAFQSDLPRAKMSADIVTQYTARLPGDLCMRLRALSLGDNEQGKPLVAVASPLNADALQQLTAALGRDPVQCIARESEIAAGLRLLRGEEGAFGVGGETAPQTPLLGDLLIERGLVQRQAFEKAMDKYRPQRHGRIGDFLVEEGVIGREVIEKVVAEQRNWQLPTGPYVAKPLVQQAQEPVIVQIETAPLPVIAVAKEAPVVQAVPEIKPVPVVQAVPEIKPVPVVQAVPEIKPVPVVQVVPEIKPVPVVQVVSEIKPVPVVQAVSEVLAPAAVASQAMSSSQRYFYIDPALMVLTPQMGGQWTACDSVLAIIRSAVGVKSPMVLLSFYRDDALRELAEAVHTLRLLLGKQASIVVVEQDASLRFQSETLLLRLGSSLVVHRNVPQNRIPLMLESLQGQVFNRDIEMKFEAALASLMTSSERGYLPPTQFVSETASTLERFDLLHLPCALVVVHPITGSSCRELLSAIHITRAGDLVTTDGEQCLIFFGCCPESSVERALEAVISDEADALIADVQFATHRSEIEAHLHALGEVGQGNRLLRTEKV